MRRGDIITCERSLGGYLPQVKKNLETVKIVTINPKQTYPSKGWPEPVEQGSVCEDLLVNTTARRQRSRTMVVGATTLDDILHADGTLRIEAREALIGAVLRRYRIDGRTLVTLMQNVDTVRNAGEAVRLLAEIPDDDWNTIVPVPELWAKMVQRT